MRIITFARLVGVSSIAFVLSCTRDTVGGSPTLPLATTNGTSHIFQTNSLLVQAAITNKLGLLKYQGCFWSRSKAQTGTTWQRAGILEAVS